MEWSRPGLRRGPVPIELPAAKLDTVASWRNRCPRTFGAPIRSGRGLRPPWQDDPLAVHVCLDEMAGSRGAKRQRIAWLGVWLSLFWFAFWTVRSLVISVGSVITGDYGDLGIALMLLPWSAYFLYLSARRVRAKPHPPDVP